VRAQQVSVEAVCDQENQYTSILAALVFIL
jgi:hypothetical protein